MDKDTKATGVVEHIEKVVGGTDDSLLENGDVKHSRIDHEILEYMEESAVDIDEETNKRLRRLINTRILPCMIGTYFLQALDKGTLSFASIMGIREDANLVGQQYSWLTTFADVKNLYFNIIAWGIVLGCHALGKHFTILVTVRTLLGFFECCCQPCFILLSSMWYRRSEQATIVALWYMMNGGQQIAGGLSSYCFTLITGASLRNWEILFLVYGCITVVWGLMLERVRSNQTGLQNRKFKKEQVYEALKDPQTYCYFFIQLLTALPTSALGAYANIIIASLGFSVLEIFLLLSSAWLASKYNQNIFFMIGYCIPSIVGTVVLMTVEFSGLDATSETYKIRRGVANIGLSLLSRNIAGQSKKSFCTAFNFVGWAAGNCIGPQVFLARDSPRYLTAFGTHMGCYAALICILIFMRVWLMKENHRKSKMIESGLAKTDEELKHAFDDLTDVENVNFRYNY
ncbi:major facilitator superfamily domain-containing protein [Scheffersomyces xylosifermentans]|uniref:major facilitator superfamily domain-containing protein n=1 Tax=Scheffersomyces xylosifermentans TaxID=1304137 RepID=UPI00315C9CF1